MFLEAKVKLVVFSESAEKIHFWCGGKPVAGAVSPQPTFHQKPFPHPLSKPYHPLNYPGFLHLDLHHHQYLIGQLDDLCQCYLDFSADHLFPR